MKTVRMMETNEVKRVPNDVAHNLVKGDKALYVPKSVWKKEIRDVKQSEEK